MAKKTMITGKKQKGLVDVTLKAFKKMGGDENLVNSVSEIFWSSKTGGTFLDFMKMIIEDFDSCEFEVTGLDFNKKTSALISTVTAKNATEVYKIEVTISASKSIIRILNMNTKVFSELCYKTQSLEEVVE